MYVYIYIYIYLHIYIYIYTRVSKRQDDKSLKEELKQFEHQMIKGDADWKAVPSAGIMILNRIMIITIIIVVVVLLLLLIMILILILINMIIMINIIIIMVSKNDNNNDISMMIAIDSNHSIKSFPDGSAVLSACPEHVVQGRAL